MTRFSCWSMKFSVHEKETYNFDQHTTFLFQPIFLLMKTKHISPNQHTTLLLQNLATNVNAYQYSKQAFTRVHISLTFVFENLLLSILLFYPWFTMQELRPRVVPANTLNFMVFCHSKVQNNNLNRFCWGVKPSTKGIFWQELHNNVTMIITKLFLDSSFKKVCACHTSTVLTKNQCGPNTEQFGCKTPIKFREIW